MRILGYGEDSLTLWAITRGLRQLLQALGDNSRPDDCQALYRPSFGRGGGPSRSEFGEFDFMLLTQQRLYLGESKWEHSSETVAEGRIQLRDAQLLRHSLFKVYVSEWLKREGAGWHEFVAQAQPVLRHHDIEKPVAPAGSLLATNLENVLEIIERHFHSLPEITDVLLYLNTSHTTPVFGSAGKGFCVVALDCSEAMDEGLVRLSI